MGLQDLIVTPIYIVLFTAIAFAIRPYVTNEQTRKYFLPALWVRFAGAIALGLIYQFYYNGGDTFNFWTHGSQWIWNAFGDDPMIGMKLLVERGNQWDAETFKYTSNIWYYRSPSSYAVVKITTFFDLFTFHTYSATALFFSLVSFSGMWALFSTVQKKYHFSSRLLAFGLLFFPSVIFWGSGILKDTITLGALGWLSWSLIRWVEDGKRHYMYILVFCVSFFVIYKIKLYILICFLPMVAFWLFLKSIKRIENIILRVLIVPILVLVFGLTGILAVNEITEDSRKYKLNNLAESARITAYDIRYGWGARIDGEGGYNIGLPDGTWQGMLTLLPASINVSLFRPYLWEARNPLMLLSALESILIFVLVIRLILKRRFKQIAKDPFLVFCLGFSILFAFAIGISTFNFGTLMRYKIPFIPFLLIVLSADFKKSKQ